MTARRLISTVGALCALLLLWGCGSATGPAAHADTPPAEAPPKPRNAHEIARGIVDGKLDVLLFVDRVRKHPIGPKVAGLPVFEEVFKGTDIEPLRDFDRLFITAPSTRAGEPVVMVGEHGLTEERLRSALEIMIARSEPPGAWLPDANVPTARIELRGESVVVGLVEPNVMVVLAAAKASELARFVGTGGLPEPEGDEAVVAVAAEPARNIHGPPFRIPPTIRHARGVVTPAADGGADLHVEGESTSEEQAKADAEELTQSIADVTTVKIVVVKIKLFDPVEFQASKKLIKGDRHLTQAELERIFSLVASNLPE